MRFFLLILFIVFATSCKTESSVNLQNVNANSLINTNKTANSSSQTTGKIPVYTYEIVNTFKHDSKAFTQGLVFYNGFLYESTGQKGDSTLRKVEINSGRVLQKQDLSDDYFAEGMTVLNDRIYQITWQENTAFVYDVNDFKPLKEFKYQGEGWGLTDDGTNLIMSDGTHVIRIVEPETFKTTRTLVVLDENGKPLLNLNELEYVKGEILANVWHSEQIGKPNHIARIDPNSGKLLGWINLQGISPDDVERDSENTLNGIAYDKTGDRIFVTGKKWRNLYEIKLKAK
ncbi:MAG: glutaminyl-peptide cyclotransferase [Acidobacteriota bacterium]|nr:glutaminyl-peptide cyclotransferase [Acidobacteriota bacterium]